ncbi:protein of unknown function [Tenacibaculum aestuariivivum]
MNHRYSQEIKPNEKWFDYKKHRKIIWLDIY